MAGLPLATADLCDSNVDLLLKGDLRVLQPIFRIYGRRLTFAGPVVTLKLSDHNVLLRELLEQKGQGRVLVVDGGGSTRCALMGGRLAQLAHDSGWAGVVINGCVRDVEDVNGVDIGVRALNAHPVKPGKKRVGEKHVTVTVAGAEIRDGDWLYADADGILVSGSELTIDI